MDSESRAVRVHAAEIAQALEIDAHHVVHVDPVREQVVAVRRAAQEAARLAGRRVRITTSRPGQLRSGRVSVVIVALDVAESDRDRLLGRARMLAEQLDRHDLQD